MRLTVLLSENESVPIHLGRHYLKSLSGDPAEPVDEVAYLHEVEREAREFFCHEHFNVMHELDAADINLILHISQMVTAESKRIDPVYFSLLFFWYNLGHVLREYLSTSVIVC